MQLFLKNKNTFLLCLLLYLPVPALAQSAQSVSFPTADGGQIQGALYQSGKQSIVLAHGAIFNKESWGPLARFLADHGLTVLAIDFRGYGQSTPGKQAEAMELDILAAIQYLHRSSHRVSVLGASMGGGAAARAAIAAEPGSIDKLILLSPVPVQHPEKIQGNKLFIASKDEPMASRVEAQYQKAPAPKQLKLIAGSTHAQHIFKTTHGEELRQVILDFLLAK